MQRITEKMLEERVNYINHLTDSPDVPRANGKAQIGNYHLSYAYGGVKLHRMTNEGGGCTEVFNTGYTTKRKLYEVMNGLVYGLEASK